jgi:beta-lactamase class A/beta-lactamase class A VEB
MEIMLKPFHFLVILSWLMACTNSSSKTETLKNQIQKIIAVKNATVGVSIIGNNGKDTLSINGDKKCPLQSVFKFHIALAVLSEIDKGKLTLYQDVDVKKEELLPDLWSPLRDENPEGGRFTIARLIQYSVSQSDNVACDVLIRLIGTPQTVEDCIKSVGIDDISIKINEEVMQAKWENMFQNWTTPKAASETLQKFYNKDLKLLSDSSYKFIWKTMKETSTGLKRIKGLLPEGTIVAHKTGSSGTNKDGLTAATNDIGIVFLPDGSYFIISVFVTDSKENDETNEQIIAEISKAAYDYFSLKSK